MASHGRAGERVYQGGARGETLQKYFSCPGDRKELTKKTKRSTHDSNQARTKPWPTRPLTSRNNLPITERIRTNEMPVKASRLYTVVNSFSIDLGEEEVKQGHSERKEDRKRLRMIRGAVGRGTFTFSHAPISRSLSSKAGTIGRRRRRRRKRRKKRKRKRRREK